MIRCHVGTVLELGEELVDLHEVTRSRRAPQTSSWPTSEPPRSAAAWLARSYGPHHVRFRRGGST